MENAVALSPISSTIIMLSLIGAMLLMPVLERVPVLGKAVSLRWSLVTVFTCLTVAVVLNFQHLSDDVRLAVILGGLCLAGFFLVARSIEKILFNNSMFKIEKIEGDLSSKKISVQGVEVGKNSSGEEPKDNKEPKEPKEPTEDDLKGLANYENNK